MTPLDLWATVQPIVTAALASLAYSLVFFAKHRERDGEELDTTKLGATVLVGIAVGITMTLSGDPLSQATLETQLMAYAGLIALVESIGKTVMAAR